MKFYNKKKKTLIRYSGYYTQIMKYELHILGYKYIILCMKKKKNNNIQLNINVSSVIVIERPTLNS